MISKSKNIQDKIDSFKKKKKRITPQLTEVLRIINGGVNHFSVSDIYLEAKKTFPSISLNTVYCILRKLHIMGEIQEIVMSSKETNYCPSSNIHHHVICIKCKKIEDIQVGLFDINDMNNTIKTDYEIKGYSVLFNGLCKSCNSNNFKNN